MTSRVKVIHSFIHSFFHSFTQSFIHSCMHACMHSFILPIISSHLISYHFISFFFRCKLYCILVRLTNNSYRLIGLLLPTAIPSFRNFRPGVCRALSGSIWYIDVYCHYRVQCTVFIPVVPHKAVAEVSKIGNL